MLASFRKLLVRQLAGLAQKIKCAGCGTEFVPYAGKELNTFSDLSRCVCPNCGREILAREMGVSSDYVGPVSRMSRPTGSNIECRPMGRNEWLYLIPPSGNSGGLLFFAIFWNLISWTVTLVFANQALKQTFRLSPALVVLIFPAIGIGLFYAAFRQKYSRHILYVSGEKIRLERELFGRKKTRDLATRNVTDVSLKSFYSQNYQPVYGIQVSSDQSPIKFGSALGEEEKKWLCGEIQANLDEIRKSM